MIKFTIPVKTVSPNRVRGLTRGAALWHAARKKKERNTAKLCAMAALHGKMPPQGWVIFGTGPVRLTFTRVAPRPLDKVNLIASMKHVEDGVAEVMKIDDGSAYWRADFAQRRGGVREHLIEVEIA